MEEKEKVRLELTQEQAEALFNNLHYLYENADMETEVEVEVYEMVKFLVGR